MTNVLCVRALQALTGLNCPNQPHLGPHHTPLPLGPGALFKLSSGLCPLL